MSLVLREAVAADAAEIVALVRELAVWEKDLEAVRLTEEDILRDGFGPKPYFHCLMAEWDGEIAGFSLYFFQYATWEGRPSLYLEDVFVREPFRRRGIGAALFKRLAQIALENGCARFQWECLDWNQTALDFYEKAGAKVLREWLNLRLTGEELSKLAKAE